MDFRDFSWWTAERVSTAANVGILVITFFTAIAAIVAVYQTKKTIKQNEIARTEHSKAALESQKQQEEYNRIASESAKHQARSVELQREAIERANRPMMTAYYLEPTAITDDLELAISNVGKTIAYDVEVSFDPELPAPDLEELNRNSESNVTFSYSIVDIAKSVFVGRVFKTWVPGQTVTTPFWVPHKDYEVKDRGGKSAEGIPASQLVHISYMDQQKVRYSEEFELDPGIWAATIFHETDLEKQRKALEKISKNLNTYLPKLASTFTKRKISSTDEENQQ